MKTLDDLDAKLTPFEDDVDPAQLPSYRAMFRRACVLTLAQTPENALDVVELGAKFNTAKTTVEFSETEYKLLVDTVAKNPVRWVAHYFAQVVMKMRSARDMAAA